MEIVSASVVPPPTKKKVSEFEPHRERIIADIRAGKTSIAIAKEFGRHVSALQDWLRRNNLSRAILNPAEAEARKPREALPREVVAGVKLRRNNSQIGARMIADLDARYDEIEKLKDGGYSAVDAALSLGIAEATLRRYVSHKGWRWPVKARRAKPDECIKELEFQDAKKFLQRRGYVVYAAAVNGHRGDMVKVDVRAMTKDEVILLARDRGFV